VTEVGLAVPVFDAHTHLDAMAHRASAAADAQYVAAVMRDASAVGVVAAITVGDTVAASRWCVAAANAHANVYAAVAVHPTEIAGMTDAHFRRHIELAKRVGKPLMIHDRDAHGDVLRILREEGPPEHVVFHAFSGDAQMARECVAAGYVLSFPGVVTFRNAPALREAATVVPLGQVLVETDAPFLTPHPYRGRPNSPALLPLTVRGLAAAAGHDLDTLCTAVAATGERVFGVPAGG
jgi:TatD DNase family protein